MFDNSGGCYLIYGGYTAMSNIISFNQNTPIDDWICMSNMVTDAFINVLSLSGSILAETTEEKQLIVWLSEKDQSFVGLGTVGFEIVEMPWNKETFTHDKNFLLNAVRSAENKLGWEKLDYIPEFILPNLKKFREQLGKMTEDDIDDNALYEWLNSADSSDPVNRGFPRCKKHHTLLTFLGCQICNSNA